MPNIFRLIIPILVIILFYYSEFNDEAFLTSEYRVINVIFAFFLGVLCGNSIRDYGNNREKNAS